ncbi:WD40 repeat-like protein [Tricholoma matsutake]|nr:WD40 repeat-like protein [Tricholoma matsutake 945]
MIQTGLIQNAHDELVTDVSYDFYGLRLATCSLDQHIKIWRLDERNGTWSVEDDWKAHDGPVSKLSWAHPEFGSIIASSSFDRTVKIWEQASLVRPAEAQPIGVNGSSGSAQSPPSNSRWVERAVLTDTRGTIRSVEFAPHHFGLKLATISSDNQLRIYECLEQPSLTTWQLMEELDVPAIPAAASPNHLSRIQTVALATPTQSHVTFDASAASASLVAQALQQSSSTGPGASSSSATSLPVRPGLGNREADGGWCISWCKDRYWGELIAAGCGTSGIIKIIQLTPSRRPTAILVLDPYPSPAPAPASHQPSADDPAPTSSAGSAAPGGMPATAEATTNATTITTPYAITTVAWAPSCGRSYHLIATGGRDGRVRIWRVKPGEELDGPREGEPEEEEGKWTASIVADFDHHKSAVGRVEWNITGTVLSSAGNDGRIRLWKATSGSVWRPAGSIGIEQVGDNEQQDNNKDADMDT